MESDEGETAVEEVKAIAEVRFKMTVFKKGLLRWMLKGPYYTPRSECDTW